MAITQCPECGGKVSTKAEACPDCGCPVEPQSLVKFFKNLISKFNVLIQLINALIFTPSYILILLIPVAMVVDLFSPGTTDIVANLSNLVNQFIDGGLVGLVVFIVGVAIIGRVLYRAYKEFRR